MIINHLKIPVILLVALFAISSPVMAKKNNKCLEVYEEQNIARCTKLAEQGDAQAQNTLGKVYYANALNFVINSVFLLNALLSPSITVI